MQGQGRTRRRSHSQLPVVMPHALVAFVTDFADQAVILPLIACVAVALWLAGWRRGAAVWCCGTAATLGLMLILKLAFRACGPEMFGGTIESPSGHTAAAGAVYGSILAFLNSRLGGPKASRVLIVLAVVTLIGATRVLLGAHTIQEAFVGGTIGFVAAQAMLSAAGEPVRGKPVTLWCAPLLLLPLLLHGYHLPAEQHIDHIAPSVWPFSLCRAPALGSSAAVAADRAHLRLGTSGKGGMQSVAEAIGGPM